MLFGPVLLVLVAAVVAVVVTVTRHRPTPPSAHDAGLDRWVSLGLITHEQAVSIAASEALPAAAVPEEHTVARPSRIPPIAEALGYLGGVLGLVGLTLLVGRYWADMATGGRLAISVGATVVLIVAGLLVRATSDPALARLRSFLWLLSSAGTALAAGIAATGWYDTSHAGTAALCCAAAAVESALLWWWRERPVQQLVALGTLVGFVGAGLGTIADPWVAGVGVWVIGAALLAVGLAWLTPAPLVTSTVGALAAAAGPVVVGADVNGPGFLFAAATTLALAALAAVPGPARSRAEQLMLGLVAAAAMLQTTPITVIHFADQAALATGLTVWAVGVAVMAAGLQRLVRLPVAAQCLGGLAIVGGAAVTGAESVAFATTFGLTTAIVLLALGSMPRQVLLSVFGAAGLLVNVPWAVAHFFPGEGRAPLLIMVSGLVIIGVAVLMARLRGRMHDELASPEQHDDEHDEPKVPVAH